MIDRTQGDEIEAEGDLIIFPRGGACVDSMFTESKGDADLLSKPLISLIAGGRRATLSD